MQMKKSKLTLNNNCLIFPPTPLYLFLTLFHPVLCYRSLKYMDYIDDSPNPLPSSMFGHWERWQETGRVK